MREIAALTIERLAQDYSRFFEIEPYLWEFEAMVASGHFQDSIEPPSAFDVVILILWSRLGTHLPERTAVREYCGLDGRTPVTGTEWEFEEAFKAAQQGGAPDLLVYRSLKPASFDIHNPDVFEHQSQQLKALNRFWERHFANQGMFIGAYTSFTTDAEFATALENHLRRLIEKRIAALANTPQPTAWAHAPFRGLETYEFEHAPIFFGQDEAVAKAMLQLITNAERGAAFLLVLGASGSGKSSLVKAGIVPKLFVPRRIAGAAFVRRVVFRPSDAREREDLFEALARRLTTQSAVSEGLPELIRHGQSQSDLATHLRNASATPGFPFGTALGEIAERARNTGHMLEYEHPKLVLVLDQLEELFGIERITPAERTHFVQLLVGLVNSGWVWVVVTMRKDFWHRADETPELVRLAEGSGRIELLPPGIAQFIQMIRRPAEATGVTFEIDATTGLPLNEAIAAEVARQPDALPLLSYLLDQIYRVDVLQAQGHALTYATYEALGRLEGAIATKAEAILRRCATEDIRELGSLLFSLVDMGPGTGDIDRAMARRVPLSSFVPGTPQRRLVEAFLDPDARLLVADAERSGNPTVRVAHEALISRWDRAREFVQRNAETLRIRRRIEERYARWFALQSQAPPAPKKGISWFRPEHGLLADIDVIDGRRLLKEHGNQMQPELVDYIERSLAHEERARRRVIRTLVGVVAIVTLLAVIALRQRNMAQMEDAMAKRTTQFMVDLFENADPDRSRGASITVREMLDQGSRALKDEADLAKEPLVRADLLTAMGQAYSGLGLYQSAINVLSQARQDEETGSAAKSVRARTLLASGTAAFLAGDDASAARYLGEAVTQAGRDPADPLYSATRTGLADVLTDQEQYPKAKTLLTEALSADRGRGSSHDALAAMANTLDSLGNTYYYSGDLKAAEAPFREALRLREQVFGMDHARTAESLNNLGALLYQSGRYTDALAQYQLAKPIYVKVYGKAHPELATLLNNMGRSALMAGRIDEGETLLSQALTMTEQFENSTHEDLVAPLNSLAMIDTYRGQFTDAQMKLARAESLARMPDHHELLDQVLLNEADLAAAQGALNRAESLLQESKMQLELEHPNRVSDAWRYAIWNSVNAEVLGMKGDAAAAAQALATAQAIIAERFGVDGFYTLAAKRRAELIANAAKAGRKDS